MNKVFINKETDMVEQILSVKTEDELPDNYFSNCYAVLDKEDKIKTYNLKYNKETKEFTEVEGIKPFDIPEVIEKVTNEEFLQLKSEKEELEKRLEKLESLLNVEEIK